MAAAFLAMNGVFGPRLRRTPAEAADAGGGRTRAPGAERAVHLRRPDALRARRLQAGRAPRPRKFAKRWNPALRARTTSSRYKFENYLKEIFLDSDTKVALLSGAPFDDPTWDLLTNDQIAAAGRLINAIAGSRAAARPRGLHARSKPAMDGRGRPRASPTLKPDSWKGYTVGDPLSPSKLASVWRLDDEKLMYPFYEKAVKSGINTICIHKGLMPADYEKSWPGVWEYNTVDDVGKAAKDWPQLNFVIYHCGVPAVPGVAGRPMRSSTRPAAWSGRPISPRSRAKFGVKNVYGEIGTSFASCAVANPRLAAALLGTLVRGLGRRPRRLGHRLGVVRLAAVADRGASAVSRSPRTCSRSTASPRWARPTAREERDLRRQLRAALQRQHPVGAGRRHDRRVAAIRAEYRDNGGDAEQHPVRVRRASLCVSSCRGAGRLIARRRTSGSPRDRERTLRQEILR